MSGRNIQASVEVRDQIRVETVTASQDDHGNNTTDTETVYCRSENTNNDNSLRRGMSSDSSTSHPPPVAIFHLSRGQRLIAGSGHILNDLCASLWFTYFLLYMQKVVKFNDSYAAALLFWGQVR